MMRITTLVVAFLMMAASLTAADPNPAPSLRLFLSEVEAGSMQSQQYCALVFADRRFHYEKASRRHGKDVNRKIYEGTFTDSDWTSLSTALDDPAFRDLTVAREVPPLVMDDSHAFAISVARGSHFQNMEFMNNKSRKQYEPQLKALLTWWKGLKNQRLSESKAEPDARCSLDNTHGVFSQ